ncbi:SEL1-like repeat protein [Pacificimonas sp. WHA3]|uniref:SEL1-like repeat protein n=1 Tax=Pacificimonas pallii TaxID=2827236 RepID=A0ABS6SEH5_9SPHN|nr:SPOR domain-containing protein [Pacificimonas pallii]MBV7256765.1 SEL1-like repeat protein [Pacificimonas pallii]
MKTGLLLRAASLMLFAFLLGGVPATASVADGVEKWKAGAYKEAVMLWLPPAARGDAHALFNLGLAARQGRGLPKDLDRAEDFFRRAALKGHNPARTYLGIFLARRGEEKEAVELWQLAARSGDPHARYMLGIRLFNGDSVARDWPRAYAYMLIARNAGLRQATRALVKMNANMPAADREKGRALANELMGFGNAADGVTVDEAVSDPAAPPAERAAAILRAEADVDGTLPRTAPANAPELAEPLPVRAAAMPQAATSSDVSGFRVQLGAYGRESVAREGWAAISAAHPDILGGISPVFAQFEGGVRLQVGAFEDRGPARDLCLRLEQAGRACFVTTAN